jgi:hypothetical protein
MGTNDLTYGPLHRGWHIQTQYAPFFTSILDRLLERFEYMVNRHGRVLFIRFDMRYPKDIAYPPDNLALQEFVNNLTQQLRRLKIDSQYVWVREKKEAARGSEEPRNHHYHFVLLLDGHDIKNTYYHIEYVTKLWAGVLGVTDRRGLIHDCRGSDGEFVVSNGAMICRNSPDFEATFGHCYYWASYLAKQETKDHTPYHVRRVGCSELRDNV